MKVALKEIPDETGHYCRVMLLVTL